MGRLSLDALIGRDLEVELLRKAAVDAASGKGQMILLDGEPGAGKTSLLDGLAVECADGQHRILRAAAERLEQRLPFGVASACLGVRDLAPAPAAGRISELLRRDGALRGAVASAMSHWEFLVVEEMLSVLEEWCAEGPVAVFLDDLHWADPSSLLMVHRLGRVAAQLPLLLVLAYRGGAGLADLTSLADSLSVGGARVLRLGPLSEAAVARLAGDVLAARPGPALLKLLAAAGGNPLYVGELTEALRGAGRVRYAAGVAEATKEARATMPSSLRDTVLRRLDFLNPAARDLLAVAAVFDAGFTTRELSLVVEQPVVELLPVLRQAVGTGVLTDSAGVLTFRHDVIRQAFVGDLPATVPEALHLRAAQALADVGAPAERVAQHLLAGGDLDGSMIDWIRGAAPTLVSRAPHEAEVLLDRALRVPDLDGRLATAFRVERVRALLLTGRAAEAQAAVRAAVAVTAPDSPEQVELRWLAIHAQFNQGRLQEALAETEAALTLAQRSEVDAARLYGFAAQCLFFLGDIPALEQAAERAIAAGQRSGDQYAAAHGFDMLANARLFEARTEEGLELADRAVALMEGQEVRADLTMAPHLTRAHCLMELDAIAASDDAFDAGMRLSERLGGIYYHWYVNGKVTLRLLDGRWDDALAEIEANQGADSLGVAPGLISSAALITIHRGAPDRYRAELESIDPGFFDYRRRWARALMWEAQGRVEPAYRLLYESWERGVGPLTQQALHRICPDVARLGAIVDDRAGIRRVTAALAPFRSTRIASKRGTLLFCEGVAEADAGKARQAAEAYGAAGFTLYQAYANEIVALLLARQGDLTGARLAADEALSGYATLDASWDTARALAALRPFGIRHGVRGQRRRPRTGWAALTGTERRVAMLVAEGLSNPAIATRLFLSRRTVQTHVSEILTKLGITSRVEIAVAVSRLPSPTD
ncbi:AAA family ATPase [Dactylosporangium sucinum]|uniref:ATP-binding protein n=1 Tax=Dactylosporangium sucinum TaxID=1424081 RepID=UPI001E3EE5B1